MQANYWHRVCRQLYAIADAVNVESNTQFIRLSVDSEVGSGAVQINRESGREERPIDQRELNVIRKSLTVCQSYALRFLVLFNRAAVLVEEVKI